MKKDQVILVDGNDAMVGIMEKIEAHQKALLHRAVSVFIFDSKGRWLLQKRASNKYHSNSLWTNTCCTHPFPDESNFDAANRRLSEEMGMQSNLSDLFHFLYKEALDNELTEHEIDHVFIGISDALPVINPDEVMEYKYIDYEDLRNDMALTPDIYTVWFRMIAEKVYNHMHHMNYIK
jgi:isopentenyl-diphosphate delta-isomerase